MVYVQEILFFFEIATHLTKQRVIKNESSFY